jgi:cold shock protein
VVAVAGGVTRPMRTKDFPIRRYFKPQLPLFRGTQPADGTPIAAIVKWFSPEKGFGFVEIGDGSGDAFLSIKALQAIGKDTVSPGAKLSVFVGQAEKGRQVTKIVAIDDSRTATAPPYAASSASRPSRR